MKTDAEHQDSNHLDGPPTYEPDQANPASGSRSEMPDSHEPGVDESDQGRSRKASYALSLQKACTTVLERVRANNMITNINWASPLATAPSAISTMAILFKVADKECAAGLEVESLDVMDAERAVVKGKLPSKYFHTNLQHCSDVGRLAFQDAQHGMNTIRETARSLISEQGQIGTIIDLLEDPEDARYNLKPEIEAVKRSAKKCLDTAQAITSKFQYWHLVIMHLKQTSLTKKGEVIKEKDVTKTKEVNAQEDEKKYRREKKALEDAIVLLHQKLASAEGNVDRAQEDVDWLRDQPLVIEPSALEEMEQIRRLIPNSPPPTKERGVFVDAKSWWFGKSDKHIQEDEQAARFHYSRLKKLQDEALEGAREQRNHQRQMAADRLRDARHEEEKARKALNDVYQELAASKYQLAEAKSNLDKTKSDLVLLSNKVVELHDIMTILDNSTRELSTLKEQIEPLVDFFREILQGISHTVDEDLEAFLRPIVNGITVGSTPDEVTALNVSRKSKKRMMSSALQMQGRFSAIVDISGAYITVSKNYIRPAIAAMEELSTLPESEWAIRSREFSERCNEYISEIDQLAQEASARADSNMRHSLDVLQRRAIEAAEENEE